MALPPDSLEALIPQVNLVVLGRVARVVVERDDAPPRRAWDGRPGPVPASSSQTVVIAIREVLKGQWPWMTVTAEKPIAPYELAVQSPYYGADEKGHLFLMKGPAPLHPGHSAEIVGLYGPTEYWEEEQVSACLHFLGHNDWPTCHDHPLRPVGYLEGAAWIVDPPSPWDFDDDNRPSREGMSLRTEADSTTVLVTHFGDSVENDVARFADIRQADKFARSLLDSTLEAKGIAPYYYRG